MIYKIIWVLRALCLKLFFGKFGVGGYLGPPLFLMGCKKMHFERNVRIFPAARIEVHGQGKLIIEQDVSIGNNLHLACAGELTIGAGVQISSFVLITDIDHEYTDVAIPIFDQLIKINKTKIGDRSFIGAGSRILAGTTLGKNCIVGTNAVVRGEIPDGSVVVGNPAKIIKRYDYSKKIWVSVK